MSYGILPTGFKAKTLNEIKAEIEADLRGTFGANINLKPRSSLGQFVGIMCEPLADLWDLAEALYAELTADGASGVQLDHVAALTGTAREAPRFSRVKATLTGTAGTVIPAESVASVSGSATRFRLEATVTIPGGGSLADVELVAVESGPKVAPAGSLTVIETPVAGWAAVTNPLDEYSLGADLERDAALRIRREIELRAQGNAAVDPIRQAVLDVDQVVQASVFENVDDTVNADGLPPHSIEVLAQGGAVNEIAQAIHDSRAGGIRTHGSTSGTALDAEGAERTVLFSRPTVLAVYITIDVKVLADDFPADGDEQIKAKLVEYGLARLVMGADVVPSALSAQAFKVSGVDEVPSVKIGTAPAPASTTRLAVGSRQVAELDTSRIVVNLV